MPNSLSNYDVTFNQNRFLGTWSWVAQKSPNGETFSSVTAFMSREAAERDALRAVERFDARETFSGAQLRDRVTKREAKTAEA